jgi:hypothetical protein
MDALSSWNQNAMVSINATAVSTISSELPIVVGEASTPPPPPLLTTS